MFGTLEYPGSENSEIHEFAGIWKLCSYFDGGRNRIDKPKSWSWELKTNFNFYAKNFHECCQQKEIT